MKILQLLIAIGAKFMNWRVSVRAPENPHGLVTDQISKIILALEHRVHQAFIEIPLSIQFVEQGEEQMENYLIGSIQRAISGLEKRYQFKEGYLK